ncbi:sugar transferase [Candidatus Pelagibacter sp.]|nr:sugar transferase [Candidatus Pelagibacter sp.]
MTLIIDIFFSTILGIIFLPIILILSILIYIFDGLPIFYRSKRVGKNLKLFNIYKFRTMKNNSKKEEITFLGKILRRTSLDEIPQLLNILKGEMSLVGPRPLPKEIINKIVIKKRVIRASIKPGITGYTQIKYSGKKRTLSEKVDLDIFYINKKNIWFYLNILFFTPLVLIKRFFYNKSGNSL